MSVVMVVKVSEGLVLGADSAATIRGKVQTLTGTQDTLKTYFNGRKLLQIGDFPIGVLTWGSAFIGSRTIESLVREWEYDEHWQSCEDYKNHACADDPAASGEAPYEVKRCAQRLLKYMGDRYNAEYSSVEPPARPGIGIVVAGYSHRTFFPGVFQFLLPNDLDKDVHDLRPDVDGKPAFGANWFGLVDAIVRLHFGRDDQLVKFVSEKYGTSVDSITQDLQRLEYVVPFAVMPLQDAIDYAYYMLNVAIGRYRFVLGPELCGGQIEIAAITQRELQWISRKTWSLEGAKR